MDGEKRSPMCRVSRTGAAFHQTRILCMRNHSTQFNHQPKRFVDFLLGFEISRHILIQRKHAPCKTIWFCGGEIFLSQFGHFLVRNSFAAIIGGADSFSCRLPGGVHGLPCARIRCSQADVPVLFKTGTKSKSGFHWQVGAVRRPEKSFLPESM